MVLKARDPVSTNNGLRPHHARRYRTPADLLHGDKGDVDGESNGRRCSPGEEIESLAGESGPSLNSALVLSK